MLNCAGSAKNPATSFARDAVDQALERRVVVVQRGVDGGRKQPVDLGVAAAEHDGRQLALAERQLHAARAGCAR